MKIWIIGDKVFFDESSFNMELLKQSRILPNVFTPKTSKQSKEVKILEAEVLQETSLQSYVDSIKEANARDSKIQAIVSKDPWFSKYENFKAELAKYSNINSKGVSLMIHPLLDKLNMLGNDKKVITKYLKSQKDFLLCEITDDVRWFEILIDFLDIKEMVDVFYQKINGYNTRVMVSNKRKDNFLKAQKNVQKAV